MAKTDSSADGLVTNKMISVRQSVGQDIKLSGVHFAKNIDEYEIQQKLKKLIKGDSYVVSIFYENDHNFTELYVGQNRFAYNDSEVFYNTMLKTIIDHYLSSDYNGSTSTLRVVTPETASLQFLVKDLVEFNSLMQHPLIEGAEHMGYFQSDIIRGF